MKFVQSCHFRTTFALLGLFFASGLGFSQTVLDSLSSPVFAGGAGGTASSDSPFSDRFNPSLSSDNQRTTLDASYFGLPDFQGNFGNAINLGVALPTRWAVFSATGSYWSLNNTNLNLGQTGRLTLSASKDIWDATALGIGIDGSLASSTWGLGLSLGFSQRLAQLGPFSDFRWGIALRDMGKGDVSQTASAVPPPFTPAFGAEGTLLKYNGLSWRLRSDLSFPSTQDICVNLGTTLNLQDVFFLNLGTAYDAREIATGIAPKIPLSVGLGFHFHTDFQNSNDLLSQHGWNQSEVQIDTAAVPLPGGTWGFGAGLRVPLGVRDTTPPVVTVPIKTWYISPNNDGVQDTLDLPVQITDERYVMGYTLTVTNPSGKVIRTIQNKETPPPAPNWDGFWKRVFYEEKGVQVPPVLVWNGMSDAGQVVPEGTYKLAITAWDDNNNKKTYDAGTVVVLLTPPLATVSAPYTEFNPTGPRNNLTINQSGSVEDLWTGDFTNAQGSVVREYSWKDSEPMNLNWDGKNTAGTLVPDGVYRYTLTGADRAGNRTTVHVDNLIVNSIPTPLSLNLDRSAFSPLGNGVHTLVFEPKPSVTTGMVNWTLQVKDEQGQVKRTLTGNGMVPTAIPFDGRNDVGQPLAEGTYLAVLTVTYSNGNTPTATSANFLLRNTPPSATVAVPAAVFSPGASDARSVVTFDQTTSKENLWTGTLTNAKGQVVRTVSWPGKADATYLWDGRGADGSILPDGTYTYVLTATDRAGNTGSSAPVSVTIDTQKRSILISTNRSAFSPVLPGDRGELKFLPQFKGANALVSWQLKIHNADGNDVRSFQGSTPVNEITWKGHDKNNVLLPDGTYTAELTAVYQNGSQPKARSNAFVIKTNAPTANLTPKWLIFSPTPKSLRPDLVIDQTTSSEPEWKGQITDAAGQTVRSWVWTEKAPNLKWDGRDENGNQVPDGTYTYTLSSTDIAGNSTQETVKDIRLDTRPTPLFLTVDAEGFSPNGDGVSDSIGFTARLGLNEGITSWTVEMVSETQGVQRTLRGTGPVPEHFSWDGTTDLKDKAPNGRYTATLQVNYEKGDAPSTQSTPFVLQATPPLLSIGLSPLPFSPDNDGYNDELNIALGVKDYAPVDTWSLEILDPAGHHFTSFTGKGAPTGKLTWDGRSDTGELVQSASDYTMVFRLSDIYGNSATVQKTLPIDVLVIRDGDRLKISIPSIHFAVNSADFLHLDSETLAKTPDAVEKNIAVLKRLADIFTRYANYKIVIEGHAVMTHWDDPARGKIEQEQELIPLSKARAEAVKNYLVGLGIAASRISTVGVGAARPIVPFSDIGNRWKDRRVEFLLVR
jgi:flagellar hook assembly protein FlgD